MRKIKLGKFAQRQLGQNGFSLVELLSVTAVLGIVMYSSLNLIMSIGNSNSIQKFSNAVITLDQDIRTTLNEPTACFNTVGAQSMTSALNVSLTQIRDAAGTVRYDTSGTYGENAVTISAITLNNYADTTGANGTAKITIVYKPKQGGKGQALTTRSFNINTVKSLVSGSPLLECSSTSQIQDSLWTRSPSDPSNIYYNAGDVGIGTSNPTAPLFVQHVKNVSVGRVAVVDFFTGDDSAVNPKLMLGYTTSGTAVTSNIIDSGSLYDLRFYTGGAYRSLLTTNGAGYLGINLPLDTNTTHTATLAQVDLVGSGTTVNVRNTSGPSAGLSLWSYSTSASGYAQSSIFANTSTTANTSLLNIPRSLVFQHPGQTNATYGQGGTMVGVPTGGGVRFAVGGQAFGNEMMRITTSGVGVGTSSPGTTMLSIVAPNNTVGLKVTAPTLPPVPAAPTVIFDTSDARSPFAWGWADAGTYYWYMYKKGGWSTYSSVGRENVFALHDAIRNGEVMYKIAGDAMGLMPWAANVGIGMGTSAPATKLQVNGTIAPDTDAAFDAGDATHRFTAVYATNAVIQTSDRRLKTAIAPLDLGLDFILRLKPVSYQWRAAGKSATEVAATDSRKHFGFIAQDVQIALRDIAIDASKNILVDRDRASGRLGLRYSELIAPIVKAVQELAENIEMLAELIELRAANARLAAENREFIAAICRHEPSADLCQVFPDSAGPQVPRPSEY